MTADSSGAGDASRLFRRLHGAEIGPEGGVRFRLWVSERILLSLEPGAVSSPCAAPGEPSGGCRR